VNYYKNTIRNLEKKINEKILAEEKLKKENESYKRELNFFKEKLKMEYINPIKKMDLNIINNCNNNKNLNIPIKSSSPLKTNKNSKNGFDNILNKSIKKKIGNCNVISNFINDLDNKKDDISPIKKNSEKKTKRIASVDEKIYQKANEKINNSINFEEKRFNSKSNNSKLKEDSVHSTKRNNQNKKNKFKILLTNSVLNNKKENVIYF